MPDEILVHVRAASLNRADLLSLAAGDEKVIGMEWAGEVAEVGSAATEWKVGERVMCSGTGGFADYAVADRGRAIRIPDGIRFEESTILMLACQTMHNAIVTCGRLRPGEALMIHGASSGVGLMGLQIGKLLCAGCVIGTSTTSTRRLRLGEFGADHAIDSSASDWVEQVMVATEGKGVDVIIDQVAGPGFKQTMMTAAVQSRIVNVGRLAGAEGVFDFNRHALQRITYTGVTFRTRSPQEVRELTRQMASDLSEAMADGRLRLPIDRVFPLSRAAEAFSRMQANEHFGKIVLSF